MTEDLNNRSTDDFRIGDIVRPADKYRHAVRAADLDPTGEFVVVGVHPDVEKSQRHVDIGSRTRPNTVGDISVMQVGGDGRMERFGMLVFEPPKRDTTLEQAIADRDRALAELATARRQAREALERYEEVRDVLNRERAAADEQITQLRSEVEQAQAAQALEAHRANKAERKAGRLQHAVDYAQKFLPDDQKGRVQGFLDGLRRQDA